MCSIFKYGNVVARNFDYEVSYDEELRFIKKGEHYSSYDIIGMCTGLVKDEPLMYDGMNSQGLVCGALAFEGNAFYKEPNEHKFSPPSYEFVLYVLRTFPSVDTVKQFISSDDFQISNENYSEDMPSSDLHWFIADKEESIIVEQTKEGLNVYDGDVMTNNPVYPNQLLGCAVDLSNVGRGVYISLDYKTRGKATYRLNGDYTSSGRFSRLTYLKKKLEESDCSFDDVSQGFHLLSSVEQIYGATPVEDKFEYTIYSIVYDMERMKVFLRRYDDVYGMEWDL